MADRLRFVLAASVTAVLAAAAVSHAAPEGGADASSEDGVRRARIAIKVGTRSVSVGEIEDRLAEVPPFQLATFGASRDEIVEAFVDQVFVRDLVLGAGAEERKLDEALPAKHQLERARSTATLRALRNGELKSPASVPLDDVKRYYEENRSRFDSPERVNLWRILCKSREEAETVLAATQKELTIPSWTALARDHSIDKATNFRGGNLGFVGPDGTSSEAGLRVDAALVKGASSTKDGDVVAQPIAEGEAFAVVWRRTTVPATKRSLEDAAPQIRATIYRERTEAQEKQLIAELRARHVRDVNADLLKIVVLPPFDAGLTPIRSTPRVP